MFERLSFRSQVMLLPIVAGVAFIVLATTSVILGVQNGAALQRIDKEFTPAERTSQKMLTTLVKIQRGLQDAVAALDEDMLEETKSDRAFMLNLIESAKRSQAQDLDEIEKIRKAFEHYYDMSFDTSRRMIGQLESDSLNDALKTMSQRYRYLKSELEKRVERSGQARQDFLVALAREAARRPIYVNIPIIVVALLIVVLLARSIASGAVKSLNEATTHLTVASSQLLSLAEQTESNTASEALSVNETLQTMEALLGKANDVGHGADSVVESADRSAEASRTIGEQIDLLNKQALKISDISESVRSIAETSDLLALNASLEGAKAGKIGRGFTYVGKEMRRLTDTVKNAVRDIQQLSKQIQELSKAADSASLEGRRLAEETTETAKQITIIAAQQRRATVQVTRAMDDIQQSSQRSVKGAKQAKHTAIELVTASNKLSKLVSGQERS